MIFDLRERAAYQDRSPSAKRAFHQLISRASIKSEASLETKNEIQAEDSETHGIEVANRPDRLSAVIRW